MTSIQHSADVLEGVSDHLPVPSEHAPRKHQQTLSDGSLVVWEDSNEQAHVRSDVTVPVLI